MRIDSPSASGEKLSGSRVGQLAQRRILDQAGDVLDLQTGNLDRIDAADLQAAESDFADSRARHVRDGQNAATTCQIARDDRLLRSRVEHELEWVRRR